MKLILQEKVVNLGNIGDQVNVKAGFGRNYLIPTGKAVPATPEFIAIFESRRAEFEKKAADVLAQAKERAEKLAEMTIKLAAKASEEGKLFGSVSPREIAEAITAQGIEINKSEVSLPEGPIRQVGEYDVALQLHSDVAATIKVTVEAAE